MPLCGLNTITAQNDQLKIAAARRCRCWDCPECARSRKAELFELAGSGHPDKFLTLTMAPTPNRSPDWNARKMKAEWTRMRRQWLAHEPGKAVEYLATFEKHKSGWPHLHILLRAPWTDIEWLRENWRSKTGAHQIKIKDVRDRQCIAAYTTKYITKDPTIFKGCKRYWRSKHYRIEPKPDKPVSPWLGMRRFTDPRCFAAVAHEYLSSGWRSVEHRHSFLMVCSPESPLWGNAEQ